jgi:CheY-like chemotaxis protein
LVEDEKVLGEMMRRQIEALGHRVTFHEASPVALEDFRAHPADFDLLVTDNTMPRMTGLELTREVLALRPDLPVLMISGLADSADLQELASRGIRKILPKPHRARELADAIRELLS